MNAITKRTVKNIEERWGVKPERPWAKYPEYMTFKAPKDPYGGGDKWFAVIMHVERRVLGLPQFVEAQHPGEMQRPGDGYDDAMVWIINVKSDPGFIMMSREINGGGFLPAYHMNKQHWLTILLDGSASEGQISSCIDLSYNMITDSPTKRIYEAVKKIPAGHVATYGQVAELAGNPKMSRAVGNALHKNNDPEHVQCFRVVNSKGELAGEFAFGGAGEQAKLLIADGIEVTDGRVDLTRFGITVIDGEIIE
ncbi:MAG: methylated-DNA--[protein]-cysteine S-methyltransferase [Eubacteriales bacterium]|nr:methylated-DNA--[protein]-cysteine S-methyltransferase [Eubacteriales bacterium]